MLERMQCEYCRTTFNSEQQLLMHVLDFMLGNYKESEFCFLIYIEIQITRWLETEL